MASVAPLAGLQSSEADDAISSRALQAHFVTPRADTINSVQSVCGAETTNHNAQKKKNYYKSLSRLNDIHGITHV